jgi:hypothetical protein
VSWSCAAALLAIAFQTQTPPPRTPPRDTATTAAKGAAIIKGRVISLEGERPLRRARVSLSAPSLSESVSTSTDSSGTYEFTDLPAGRYTVSVARSGYLPLQYGQTRPGEAARPVEVRDGEVIGRVDFALPRASAISGRVTDEAGEPFPGVLVWAVQLQYFRGARRLVPVSSGGLGGGNRTDDTGQFRLLGLPPGEYYVMGTTRETWSADEDQKEVFGYASTYFPGATTGAEAQRVKVGVGQEAAGIDFMMVPMRAASVSGSALGADGTPMAGATVSLGFEISGPSFAMMGMVAAAKVAADGTWRIRDVPPGDYQLRVTSADRDRPPESATATVTVSGTDVDAVMLVPDAGATVAGRVVTDDGSPLPAPRLVVRMQSAAAGRPPIMGLGAVRDNGLVGADGSFECKGPSGPSIVRVSTLPSGWAVGRVDVGARDHVHVPLDLRSGQRVEGLTVVLTKALPQLGGRVLDDRGEPADGTVLLFPADRAHWIEAAGVLRSARPDQSGRFRFDLVHPGEYLIVAIEYVQRWQVVDPEFLEEQRRRATKVSIGATTGKPVTLVLQR